MAFLSGSLLIDAPASALNNSGEGIVGSGNDNTMAVKIIYGQGGQQYPYVSGQAFRYWLRMTLEMETDIEWPASIIFRTNKGVYTDANPILYWDDDLFGYMRAPGKTDYKKTKDDEDAAGMTPLELDEKNNPRVVTRLSPFRIGTLVSLYPTSPTVDFGTMARQQGAPVLYVHQFYRTVLHTLFALDLRMVGTFTYLRRAGFQNLDAVRIQQASTIEGIEHLPDQFAYRLPAPARLQRITSLLTGLGRMYGGAKQTIHYTDVSPTILIFGIVRGGNNPFSYLVTQSPEQNTVFHTEAFVEILNDLQSRNQLLSPVYIGWKPGFLSDERARVQSLQVDNSQIIFDTPQAVLSQVLQFLSASPALMDE